MKNFFCPLILFTVVIIIILFFKEVKSEIIINELMAKSISVYPDMCDYDDFSDWIELYNPSDSIVSLSNYYLTDNLNNPKKWKFPDHAKIQPKGYFVVRADGFDADSGKIDTLDSYPWNVKFITQRYHTNFQLAEEGEEVALFKTNPKGEVIKVDEVIYPYQLQDVSWGLNPNDGKWYRYDFPTPGGPNNTDPKTAERFSEEVHFSLPGGFYDGPQTIILSSSSGEVYYTTDGSIPNKNSLKYKGPITIEKTTVLRARCIDPNLLAGKVSTNTYFINEKKRSLMMISIVTDSSFLYDKQIGVFQNSFKGRRIPVSMEFFTPDGKQVIKVSAGISLGSLTNFTCPQKPMQVALKNAYGDDYIWYKLFDKNFVCFRRLRLRQGGDAWETNLIADGILEAMAKGQLECGVQAYRPVVVFINGKYYGIHDLREQFDDQYFINNYNVDPTTKDEIRSILMPAQGKIVEGWELVSGSWDSYRNLISFVKNGEMTDEKYKQVKEQINIKSFVDFISAIAFGNQISWGHNEDLWKVKDTKWQWLTADFDRCFVYKDMYADYKHNIFTTPAGLSSSIMHQDTLFFSLIKNTELKNYFIQRLAAHLNSTFRPSRLIGIVDSIVAMLEPEMEEYTAKWGSVGGIKSVSFWKSQIDSVKAFIRERGKYIYSFLQEAPFNCKGTAVLNVTLSNPSAGEIYINEVRMSQGTDSILLFTDIPFQLKAIAKSGYVFEKWENGPTTDTMTLTLTGNKSIKAIFQPCEDHILPSIIKENTTLALTDHPYIGKGDVIVEKGATLTIEKGITILMPENSDIIIRGKLLINGTAEAPVTIKENTKAGAKKWGALCFDSTMEKNIIKYAIITGTTNGRDALKNRGGISGNYSDLEIDNLTMYNILYPLYFEGGNTVIRNSKVTVDHICNGAVHIGRGKALIENSTWISTGVTINTDAIDIKGVENGIIKGNKIYNFNGINSDAIDLGEDAKNILISDNIIYGSYDKGISIGGKSTAKIINNIIVECDLGIGIKDEGSYIEVDRNTFIRNRIGIAVYAKVFGRGGALAKVKNSIFAASKSRSFFADFYSTVSFSYCLSDRDIIPGENNIFGDPAFVDIYKNDFRLQSFSPCINAGDPSSPKDADGSICDIGANIPLSENEFPKDLVPPYNPPLIVFNEIMYNPPRENRCEDWIEIYNTTDKDISLNGWKLTDKGDYKNWEKKVEISEVDSEDIFFFPQSAKIPAKGYLVICRDTLAFSKFYPHVKNRIGNLPFGLNGTETIFLYNEKDVLLNVITIDKVEPWSEKPNGEGPTLELSNPNHFNFHPLNWHPSTVAGGTPGNNNTTLIRKYVRNPSSSFLAQNFPNPAKINTTIQFYLLKKENVKLCTYNLSGKLITKLIDKKMVAGSHTIRLDVRNFAAGTYFYQLTTPSFSCTRKLTIER